MNFDKKDSPLKECVKFIESCKKGYAEDECPYIQGEKETCFKISESSMFKIPKCEESRRLGFVDGGTGILVRSSDFNVSFTRIAGVLSENNKITPLHHTPQRIEFYSATVLESSEDDELVYSTHLFPLESEYDDYLPDREITISAEESRTRGGFLPNIEAFGGIIMRFAEWSYGTKFLENELKEGDIYVRDGSLQTGFKDEILLTRELFSTGMAKKVYITGLSKSCRLITKDGDSLITFIDIIGSKKYPTTCWYYHPIYQITKADNQADVYFVKLHEFSSYPFRFDIYIEQSKNLDQQEKEIILSNLAENSNDLSFPGYPFGLIKADQMVKVGQSEIEPLKMQLLSEFDAEHYNKYIKPRLRSVDAHDLLNILRK
jgi:hypothetical protein